MKIIFKSQEQHNVTGTKSFIHYFTADAHKKIISRRICLTFSNTWEIDTLE